MARHLVYAGEMMEIDPEVAYDHARAAYQSAARIDVVREALGLTAYATERYSEALRELRTYRRMSDDYTHVPLEADSERGLGRAEKALRFIEGIPLQRLNAISQVELALVTSGARAETGDSEGGLSVLDKILIDNLPEELASRVQLTKADRLAELGRDDEANELRETWQPVYEDQGGDMMVDLDDVLDNIPDEVQVDGDEGEYADDFGGDEFDGEDFENAEFDDEDLDDEDLDDEESVDEASDEDLADEEFDEENAVEPVEDEYVDELSEADFEDDSEDELAETGAFDVPDEDVVVDTDELSEAEALDNLDEDELNQALEDDQDLDLNEMDELDDLDDELADDFVEEDDN